MLQFTSPQASVRRWPSLRTSKWTKVCFSNRNSYWLLLRETAEVAEWHPPPFFGERGLFAYLKASAWGAGFWFHTPLEVYWWRRWWHPTPVLLPRKSHGRRSLEGCSPWGRWGSDSTEWLHFHALEKEMATHSSVLAWRIPGTGEPGGLPSVGLQSRTRLKWLSSSSSSRGLLK